MRILAIASQASGSGKTMLAAHLAVQAERSGAGPVVVVDAATSGALSHWWHIRDTELPAFARPGEPGLAATLQALRQQGFKLAIIDTASTTMADAVPCAELVVLPIRAGEGEAIPTEPDGAVALCERAGKPVLFVINGAAPRVQLTPDLAIALSRHGKIAPVPVHHRSDFTVAMIDGLTVSEAAPDSLSAGEITALWSSVSSRFETNFRRTVFAAPERVGTMMQARPLPGFGRRLVRS